MMSTSEADILLSEIAETPLHEPLVSEARYVVFTFSLAWIPAGPACSLLQSKINGNVEFLFFGRRTLPDVSEDSHSY